MRNTTSNLAIAAVLASGMIGPALADVTVLVDVSKDKTITVDEVVTIIKTVSIRADFDLFLDGAAEAQALANIRNEDNDVTYNDADPTDVDFSAVLDLSVLLNLGITGVNQDAGTNAKQGNVVAVGIADSGDAFAGAQAEADQINRRNQVTEGDQDPFHPQLGSPFPNPAIVPNTAVYEADITDSINGNPAGASGIIGVNQNAGNNNSQLNMVALAAGVELDDQGEEGANPDVTAALSEAALGQLNVGFPPPIEGPQVNSVQETGTFKTASLTRSLNDHRGGVIGTNQAAGNNANQGNLVSVAASVRF